MQIGIDSFAALMPDHASGEIPSAALRMARLIEEVEAADRAGLTSFGIGEHHRADFIDAAPAVMLAACAMRTRTIRLHSAVTVLSAADPVRVFQEFATLDLLSGGRAEIVAGRGSFVDAFPLFGLPLDHYDALFAEKLDLLLALRETATPTWSGRFRPPLTGQGVFPRPAQPMLPIWLGIGGSPDSAIRAGTLGLPMMIAIIGGSFDRFRGLADLYRQAGRQAGHPPERLRLGIHAMGFLADTDSQARDVFFKGWFHMFSTISKERGGGPPTRAQFDTLCGPSGAFLVGSPATVAAKLEHMDQALGGVDRINFQMSPACGDHAAMLGSIRLLGDLKAGRRPDPPKGSRPLETRSLKNLDSRGEP